jgi:tetratricopeptide (TPR) repeat protein
VLRLLIDTATSGGYRVAAERKLVTALSAETHDFALEAAGQDPERVQNLVADFEAAVEAEVVRSGGTLERLGQGSAVALFGAPLGHEDDPERAVRTGLALTGRLANLRVGISTAESLVSTSASPRLGLAWGAVIEAAARLQAAAPRGGVLVDERTQRASRLAIAYEPLEASWAWLARAARDAPEPKPELGALVGRYAELGRLLDVWAEVKRAHRPALVVLLGEAGVGKSRLADEFARTLDAAAGVLRGHCLSYGESITYWPLREIVRAAAGIPASAGAEQALPAFEAFVERLPAKTTDELEDLVVAIADLAGCPREGAVPVASRSELRWAIRRLLELLAAERPCVVLIEDVHWAEQELLETLDSVVASVQAPLLVLATARTDLGARWRRLADPDSPAHLVTLAPLTAAESQALLTRLLCKRELQVPDTAAMLLERAGGNPLFVEELVATLSERGIADAAAHSTVPESLERLIGARLDSLLESQKKLLSYASLLGSRFSSAALADLLDDADLDPQLEELADRDLIHPTTQEPGWAFKHTLVRDVAYARVPKRSRASLHIAIAERLRTLDEQLAIEFIAYHLEQACLLRRQLRTAEPPPIKAAVAALTRAGERAQSRDGLREAESIYLRALNLTADAGQELQLRLKLGDVLNRLGELDRAGATLADVAEQAQTADQPDVQATALIGMANIARKLGRRSDGNRYLTEAENLAREVDNAALQVRAIYERAAFCDWFETDASAIPELKRGLTLAEQLDDTELRIHGHNVLGVACFNHGELAAAEMHHLRALSTAAAARLRRLEAQGMSMLAAVKYYHGSLEEAERLGTEARARLERTGEASPHAQCLRILAFCALARDDASLAEQLLREALPLAHGIGGSLLLEIHRRLIDILIRQNRIDEARELAPLSEENTAAEDPYGRAAAHLIQASIATAEGSRTAAERHFKEALETLKQHQLLIDLGEARVEYGRALRQLGDERAAQAELADARRVLERLGALHLVDQIDQKLAAPGAGQLMRQPAGDT